MHVHLFQASLPGIRDPEVTLSARLLQVIHFHSIYVMEAQDLSKSKSLMVCVLHCISDVAKGSFCFRKSSEVHLCCSNASMNWFATPEYHLSSRMYRRQREMIEFSGSTGPGRDHFTPFRSVSLSHVFFNAIGKHATGAVRTTVTRSSYRVYISWRSVCSKEDLGADVHARCSTLSIMYHISQLTYRGTSVLSSILIYSLRQPVRVYGPLGCSRIYLIILVVKSLYSPKTLP